MIATILSTFSNLLKERTPNLSLEITATAEYWEYTTSCFYIVIKTPNEIHVVRLPLHGITEADLKITGRMTTRIHDEINKLLPRLGIPF